MLFAVVALMAVGTTFGIIGGKDAARTQFPYFAYLESYKIAERPVSYSFNSSTDSVPFNLSCLPISKSFIESAEVRSLTINGF